MVHQHFGLTQLPFATVPDTSLLVNVQGIKDVIGRVESCVETGSGIAVVIGPGGCGKSLLLQKIAQDFASEFLVVQLISGSLNSRLDLLQTILFQLGQPFKGMDETELRLSLTDFIKPSEQCPHGLLVLADEAHSLKTSLLEELRRLMNTVHEGQPRLRLVLAGLYPLEETLAMPRLDAVNQRITSRMYLNPLNRDETYLYTISQVQLCGGDGRTLFQPAALEELQKVSGGIPRLINQICRHAMIEAARQGETQIDAQRISCTWSELQCLPYANQTNNLPTLQPDTSVIEFGSLESQAGSLESQADSSVNSIELTDDGSDHLLPNSSGNQEFDATEHESSTCNWSPTTLETNALPATEPLNSEEIESARSHEVAEEFHAPELADSQANCAPGEPPEQFSTQREIEELLTELDALDLPLPESPESHEAHETHEAHEAHETHEAHEAHEAYETHEAPGLGESHETPATPASGHDVAEPESPLDQPNPNEERFTKEQALQQHLPPTSEKAPYDHAAEPQTAASYEFQYDSFTPFESPIQWDNAIQAADADAQTTPLPDAEPPRDEETRASSLFPDPFAEDFPDVEPVSSDIKVAGDFNRLAASLAHDDLSDLPVPTPQETTSEIPTIQIVESAEHNQLNAQPSSETTAHTGVDEADVDHADVGQVETARPATLDFPSTESASPHAQSPGDDSPKTEVERSSSNSQVTVSETQPRGERSMPASLPNEPVRNSSLPIEYPIEQHDSYARQDSQGEQPSASDQSSENDDRDMILVSRLDNLQTAEAPGRKDSEPTTRAGDSNDKSASGTAFRIELKDLFQQLRSFESES